MRKKKCLKKLFHYDAAFNRKLVYLKQCLPLDKQWNQKSEETAKCIRIKQRLFKTRKKWCD